MPTTRRHPLAGARLPAPAPADERSHSVCATGQRLLKCLRRRRHGRCPLVSPDPGLAVLARLSVQKRVRLSGQFGEALRKNYNFWRDSGAFVHDCLMIISSVLIDM